MSGVRVLHAGVGQPSLQEHTANPNPSLEDWVNAYKPLDAAINKVFETRINKNNAGDQQLKLYQVGIGDLPHRTLATAQNLACGISLPALCNRRCIGKDLTVKNCCPCAQAGAPLQSLINDVTQQQGKDIQSFAKQFFAGQDPLTGGSAIATSNPLTGTASTVASPTAVSTYNSDRHRLLRGLPLPQLRREWCKRFSSRTCCAHARL